VHPAPPPAVSTRDSPRLQPPTRSKTGVGSPHGPKEAVPSIHARFHKESPCHRLNGLRAGHGTPVEHNEDDVNYRRPVVLDGNVHHENVHVAPTNASTQGRSRGGGVRDERNERRWTFVREQQCVSDALASSLDRRTLKNNKRHWTFVHEGQGAPDTLVSSSDPNASQRMRYDPSYGCQTAVSSKSQRFPSELHHHRLEALRQCPSDTAHEKRSNVNVDPRTNLRCLLELPLD
jgi:hypothetical protein